MERQLRATPGYAELIQEFAPNVHPALVEGWMRLEHPVLSGLDRAAFKAEVKLALTCIELDGIESSRDLALSFGLAEEVPT